MCSRTHGHIREFVDTAVGIDAIQPWAVNVYTPKHKRGTDIALVLVQHLLQHAARRGHPRLSVGAQAMQLKL